jgi:hypothetical protein
VTPQSVLRADHTPTLMPESWEPSRFGKERNPAWDLAIANPGRWVKSTLKSGPNVHAMNERLTTGKFRASQQAFGPDQGHYIRYDADPGARVGRRQRRSERRNP